VKSLIIGHDTNELGKICRMSSFGPESFVSCLLPKHIKITYMVKLNTFWTEFVSPRQYPPSAQCCPLHTGLPRTVHSEPSDQVTLQSAMFETQHNAYRDCATSDDDIKLPSF